jgi:hypothetical protein
LESLVTLPLHSQELQDKLNEKLQLLQGECNGNYSTNKLTPNTKKYVYEAWCAPLLFSSVIKKKAAQVFVAKHINSNTQ